MNYKFTSILIKEKEWYVARCVELGVVSQGKTVEEAQKNLKEAVELYKEMALRPLQLKIYFKKGS